MDPYRNTFVIRFPCYTAEWMSFCLLGSLGGCLGNGIGPPGYYNHATAKKPLAVEFDLTPPSSTKKCSLAAALFVSHSLALRCDLNQLQ